MRALVALAVIFMMVAEPSASATPPSQPASPAFTFAPVALPIGRSGPAEAARLPSTTPVVEALAVIRDEGVAPIPTPVRRAQPEVRPQAVRKPDLSHPVAYRGRTSHVLRGPASWYCNRDGGRGFISPCHSAYTDTGGFDAYAAAGPRLRAAIGDSWRGRIVSVDGLRVKLVDWCQCYEGQANEKVIDLYLDVYRVVGGSVTIRW
jgi:hypothetical protein